MHKQQVLQNRNLNLSKSDLIQILECEEFYQRLHKRELAPEDRMIIQEFVFKSLKPTDWEDFLKLCKKNSLNPYEEIRDLIYYTYAKILRQTN